MHQTARRPHAADLDRVARLKRTAGGEPVWELVARNLRARKTVAAPQLNLPTLKGVDGNPGLTA